MFTIKLNMPARPFMSAQTALDFYGHPVVSDDWILSGTTKREQFSRPLDD